MSAAGRDLAGAVGRAARELDTCVHCGFCLPACPTYVRLGDEADSPRGRLHLMRAVVEGRLDAGSEAFQTHLDRCLGCRACEPVCPSGVPYGSLLETARAVARERRRPGIATRLFLWSFARPARHRWFLRSGRWLRDRGWARALAERLPRGGWAGSLGRGLSMLAGSTAWNPGRFGGTDPAGGNGHSGAGPDASASRAGAGRPVALLRGCVQGTLFTRVNDATAGVLRVNGFQVVPVPGQGCCGALHAHAGDLAEARRLARINVEAFEAAGVDRIVVNAAGCGAALREYGSWFDDEPVWRDRARAVAARSVDVSVLLAEGATVTGGAVRGAVVYHPPCHLEHAQGVRDEPRALLRSIPGLRVCEAEGPAECCGGAGLYGITHPELGGRIGTDRARALADTEALCVATGNPGCMMQLGAFLHEVGAGLDVAHPVELLAESYRRAGLLAPDEGVGLRE